MNSSQDVNKIRKAIANNEGVVACEINMEKKEVNVVYDSYFLQADDLIAALEDLGYTVL
jgi:copper chaperone